MRGLAQLGGLLPLPSPTPTISTSTVTGQATGVQASVYSILGTVTTALADTGVIGTTNVAQDAGQVTGSVASLLSADVLSSSTYSYADEVDSLSSVGDLNLIVAGVSITADSVVAEASQALGAMGTGSSYVDGLAINGTPVALTGAANQTIWIPGGQIAINEQTISSTGAAVVNALHVTVIGVADVVVGLAKAGIS
jgi:hypothetical protein